MTAMPNLTCFREIDAPAHEVWRVLTIPDLVHEWARAYREGLSIRTSWRVGEPVTWKARGGDIQLRGKIAAYQPGRLLKVDYDAAPDGARAGFSETFQIEPLDRRSRLVLTTGPLDDAACAAMNIQAELAVDEIKSLAEESARIHGLR